MTKIKRPHICKWSLLWDYKPNLHISKNCNIWRSGILFSWGSNNEILILTSKQFLITTSYITLLKTSDIKLIIKDTLYKIKIHEIN